MRAVFLAVVTAVSLGGGAGNLAAQECWERVGEATGPSRDAAMRLAYANALKLVNEGLSQAWLTSGLRIGEAPGHTIRKLGTNCSVGGAGQICRITMTICRN